MYREKYSKQSVHVTELYQYNRSRCEWNVHNVGFSLKLEHIERKIP